MKSKAQIKASLDKAGIHGITKAQLPRAVAKLKLVRELEKMGIVVKAGKVSKTDIKAALARVDKAIANTKTAVKYQLTDWHYDHPDYFQGIGTYGTNYDDAFVGDGDSPMDAASEALDMASQTVDFPDSMLKDIEADIEKIGDKFDRPEGDMRYFVGLRVKYAK